MSLILMLSYSLPSVEAATTSESEPESETIFIEGTSYTYDYNYEGDNRIIYITNNDDNSVEKVSYNKGDSTIYYNDEAVGTVEKENNIDSSDSASINSIWSTVDSGSNYISWIEGATAAVAAAAIAVPLAGLGAGGVVAAMGTAALGALAGVAIGGTVNYELQRYTPIFGAPQHQFVWSFTASTGDYYGEYASPI